MRLFERIPLIAFIRLRYYTEVFKTMQYLNEHISYEPAFELHQYWMELYRNKISFLLEKYHNKMFK